MGEAKPESNRQSQPVLSVIGNTLASVKFAVGLVVVIAAACVVGTLLPQGGDVAAYVQQNPEATQRMAVLGKLGLTNVFYTGWFLVLLGMLCASIAMCSTRRLATIRRTTGYARGRAFGSMLTHISFLLITAGAVVRGVWGEKGYLELREGQTAAQFVDNRGVSDLPFKLYLREFEIERYTHPDAAGDKLYVNCIERNVTAALPVLTNGVHKFLDWSIEVLRYVPDFMVDSSSKQIISRSDQPRNPALLIAVTGPTYQNHRWVFANFPEHSMQVSGTPGQSPLRFFYQNAAQATAQSAPIKSFKSTLAIIDGNRVELERTIEVNSPLTYKGYRFYQSGYNPKDLTYTSLQVVRDPGVPLVYAGFGLMLLGLTQVFYINPWLNNRSRRQPVGGA